MRNQLLMLQDVSVAVAENNSGRIQVTHIRCAAAPPPVRRGLTSDVPSDRGIAVFLKLNIKVLFTDSAYFFESQKIYF